jgi:hypothetical protein
MGFLCKERKEKMKWSLRLEVFVQIGNLLLRFGLHADLVQIEFGLLLRDYILPMLQFCMWIGHKK